jgi:hypothetical protein
LRIILIIGYVSGILLVSTSTAFAQDLGVQVDANRNESVEQVSQLFRDGRLHESRKILYELIESGQITDDGYLMLAYIEFWDGYPSRALSHLNKISIGYHDVSSIQFLRMEIRNQQTGQISLSYTSKNDNQPLSSDQFSIGGTVYKNRFFNPLVNFDYLSFDAENKRINTIKILANNTFRTGLSGHAFTASFGLYSDDKIDNTAIIGGIRYSHRLTPKLYSDIEFAKEPYLYHYRSLLVPFFTYQFISGLRYYTDNRYYSEIKFQRWLYEDENHQDIFSFYFIQNILTQTRTNLYIGYSFSYSHADQSRFIIDQAESILPNTENISGVYFPYYTPNQDMSHSILLSTQSNVSSNITVDLAIKHGLYSTARQPFYYVEQSNPPTTSFATYDFQYYPLEISGKVVFRVSSSVALQGSYEYKRLKYYTTNDVFFVLRFFI